MRNIYIAICAVMVAAFINAFSGSPCYSVYEYPMLRDDRSSNPITAIKWTTLNTVCAKSFDQYDTMLIHGMRSTYNP